MAKKKKTSRRKAKESPDAASKKAQRNGGLPGPEVANGPQGAAQAPGEGEVLNPSGLLTDPSYMRGDAKMVAKMLALGVIPVEQCEALIAQGHRMLAEAAVSSNSRTYISLMRMLIEAARLGQTERHKLLDKAVPDQHAITVQQGAMVRAALEEIEGDERFEQLARDGAARDYAGIVGGQGQQGVLVGGSASQTDRQGSNGFAPSSNGSANPDH